MTSTPYQPSVSTGSVTDAFTLTIPVFAASAIANGNELTDFVPGFTFQILSLAYVSVTPITTGGKTATITPQIDTVAVPGCVLTVAGTQAKGVVTAATPPTGAILAGSATSKIRLVASAVTAFSEGAGYFVLTLGVLGNIS